MANHNGFLVPTVNSYPPPVYPLSSSNNAAPNSFMPVYAPNMSGNSVPQSFSYVPNMAGNSVAQSFGYATPMDTDTFMPVYSPSMSTPSFSFSESLNNMNWNEPMFQASPNTTKWLQEQMSPVSAERTSLLPEASAGSLPTLPHPTQPLPTLPDPTAEGTSDSSTAAATKPSVEPVATKQITRKVAPKPKPAKGHGKSTGNHTVSQPSGGSPSTKLSPSGNATPGSASLTSDSAKPEGRTSKRVPIKSRRNELADAIGTDVGLSAGAQSSLKRPAQNKPASAGAPKKKRAKS
ncbi:hypothetical protein CY34DRAFT_15255 [Suillus luteus UH-Slu-Lm8-n1]|uniref:Uncharacterized protein n=1 Tax=Suillus luteus UH-Slu-Lm8-n1 TaxID=930992 RepID=A0A0D0B2B8_9AGAM|nr:hypothetical protein CY34DRAFT_15255 [Suillus luteus UH-Slu-Lm8-n1]